eukprot:TRINITY_DN5902_c0_g1_i4.p3 TRINITY_DN5902_c0_g1~~TRINITY_DN5902_c0_g1_i4.p3  ORF type:complete len:124 (+),score=12.27 TRINITY_DN5902_c0_g1_i4:459-830(+)
MKKGWERKMQNKKRVFKKARIYILACRPGSHNAACFERATGQPLRGSYGVRKRKKRRKKKAITLRKKKKRDREKSEKEKGKKERNSTAVPGTGGFAIAKPHAKKKRKKNAAEQSSGWCIPGGS